MSSREGKLFVISAPSGAGKTTLCNMLRDEFPGIAYSVSYTTRPPRPDETHGTQYYFVPKETFEEKIASGDFLEYAVVHENYYGTSGNEVKKNLAGGKNILLDIDPQGAMQLKGKFDRGVYIFIMPPSIDTLRRRLTLRNNTRESIEIRLANAAGEIAYKNRYDYIIVNDALEHAYAELSDIYRREENK
ncbi:MAG: guanylate kinase [Deferribacteraceae bacterium]|jgi:guanylate kinase|nr:guanylate kinase [Deferribacteraceae bacterium]